MSTFKTRNKIVLLSVLLTVVFCIPSFSHAGPPDVSLTPGLFQKVLGAAGIRSDILDAEAGTSVVIDDLKGALVVIGFPEEGLRRNRAFYLEIDGYGAVVELDEEDSLVILEGDERISQTGILGIIECLVSTVINTITSVIDELLNLQILEAITSLINGIIGIIVCILL